MLLSAVSVLVVAQSSSKIPEGLMNNPVYIYIYIYVDFEMHGAAMKIILYYHQSLLKTKIYRFFSCSTYCCPLDLVDNACLRVQKFRSPVKDVCFGVAALVNNNFVFYIGFLREYMLTSESELSYFLNSLK